MTRIGGSSSVTTAGSSPGGVFFSKKVKHLVVDFSLSHCFPRFFNRVVKGGVQGEGVP